MKAALYGTLSPFLTLSVPLSPPLSLSFTAPCRPKPKNDNVDSAKRPEKPTEKNTRAWRLFVCIIRGVTCHLVRGLSALRSLHTYQLRYVHPVPSEYMLACDNVFLVAFFFRMPSPNIHPALFSAFSQCLPPRFSHCSRLNLIRTSFLMPIRTSLPHFDPQINVSSF